jgi:hypothetical protein
MNSTHLVQITSIVRKSLVRFQKLRTFCFQKKGKVDGYLPYLSSWSTLHTTRMVIVASLAQDLLNLVEYTPLSSRHVLSVSVA